MEINIEKLKRQQQGVEKWRSHGGRGILLYEMGVGKTFTAMLIINNYLKVNDDEIYIVLPSDPIKTQWQNAVKQFVTKKQNKIIFTTPNQIILNNTRANCGLLIIDEIHEFESGNKLDIVKGHYIEYKFILALTGSLKNNSPILEYLKVVDRIDQEEALKRKFILPIIEYNLPIELTKSEQEKYNYFNSKIEQFKNIFQNFNIAISCIKGQNAHRNRIEIAKRNGWVEDMPTYDINKKRENDKVAPSKIYTYAVDFVSIVQERAKLVYKAMNKIEPTIQLCKRYNVKTIVFSQSTEFADRLFFDINFKLREKDLLSNPNEEVKDVCSIYHSNMKTRIEIDNGKQKKVGKIKLKKRAIDEITSGKTRIFITTSVMDRGLNIEDLRMGIATSFIQDVERNNQRNSRINRVENSNPNIKVLMVNIYAKNTVEEVWLKNKQKNSKNLIRPVNSVNEINHIFETNNNV